MYEYKDKGGEWITLRSTRTLERLLLSGEIVGTTPFRLSQESEFVPAALHPVPPGVAAALGLDLQPPRRREKLRDVSVPQPEAETNEPPGEATTRPPLVSSLPPSVQEQVAGALDSGMNFWKARASTSPTTPRARRPSIAAAEPLVPTTRPLSMNLPERSMSALRGVFGWIAGALVAGLVIKIVVLATGLDGFSDIIAAISILLVGRHGGQKMMTEGRIPSAANLWTAGTATAVISTLGGGSVGLLGAGLAIGGLAWGLKGGARA